MIKISFSGILGSGKTSLLIESKKILSLKYEVEVVDDIIQKNPFNTDRKSNFISHFFQVSSQINEENIKSLSAPDILLCDNSVLDHWITWVKYTSEIENSNQMVEKKALIRDLYQFWIKTYNLIFLIKADHQKLDQRNQQNEFAIPDLEYLKDIESHYNDVIKKDQIQIIEIWNNNSIDESANNIIKHISELNNK